MNYVRPKKKLGQHFLIDENIARKIVESLSSTSNKVLEIGPGMGVLTKYLIERENINLHIIEIDSESVTYLQKNYPQIDHLYAEDFLKFDIQSVIKGNFAIIGNFPYNISSQIFFKVIILKNQVNEVVCMIQKEVAQRIHSTPNNKSYGILSVLLQTYYNIEYLFTVNEHVFQPPPKVKSAVIKLTRNNRLQLDCDEKLFFSVVKMAFNQRRKMIRKSLGSIVKELPTHFATKRPEQLSVEDFIELTKFIEHLNK